MSTSAFLADRVASLLPKTTAHAAADAAWSCSTYQSDPSVPCFRTVCCTPYGFCETVHIQCY